MCSGVDSRASVAALGSFDEAVADGGSNIRTMMHEERT